MGSEECGCVGVRDEKKGRLLTSAVTRFFQSISEITRDTGLVLTAFHEDTMNNGGESLSLYCVLGASWPQHALVDVHEVTRRLVG